MHGPNLSPEFYTESIDDLVVRLDPATKAAQPEQIDSIEDNKRGLFSLYYSTKRLYADKEGFPSQPNALRALTLAAFSSPTTNLPGLVLSGDYEYRDENDRLYLAKDPEVMPLRICVPTERTTNLICHHLYKESPGYITLGDGLSIQIAELLYGYYKRNQDDSHFTP